MSAIRINGLTKAFGTFTALHSLTLNVEQGEFITLLGPSGCGKTTLLKLISGFLEPTTGSIEINGEDVTKQPPEKRDTALCFQSYALFPHLTVRENLEFGLKQQKVPTDERKMRIADVAEKLELGPQMKRLPNQLSGGQQQRVSLGRALVMRPSIILFDEPLSNLDAKLRDQIRFEIRRIQKDYELTAIYVTHDQSEALAMSDRIVVLCDGRVEQIDTPEALYHKPRTPFVADFIGGANVFEGEIARDPNDGEPIVKTKIGTFRTVKLTGSVGQKMSIAWRPERAELVEGDVPLGQTIIEGIVANRAFQGSFTELIIETAGISYRVVVDRDAPEEGETIQLTVATDDVILLEQGA